MSADEVREESKEQKERREESEVPREESEVHSDADSDLQPQAQAPPPRVDSSQPVDSEGSGQIDLAMVQPGPAVAAPQENPKGSSLIPENWRKS